ncbi:unnamed protein product [Parascedosporium putredinis]|uniref:Uncharacterized protein n=1 Tax=Parascedosporium putredinis TaxID=1442378 RepID=A0A9P1GXJ6_9PEZI|nr:unnamed protein product [Parascedosporium putredinis]CAI7989064.1 unnamed protein product [Parascedosporium putredinis]
MDLLEDLLAFQKRRPPARMHFNQFPRALSCARTLPRDTGIPASDAALHHVGGIMHPLASHGGHGIPVSSNFRSLVV